VQTLVEFMTDSTREKEEADLVDMTYRRTMWRA